MRSSRAWSREWVALSADLIPADVRYRLKALGLATWRAVGDRGIGAHASRSRGAGLEFAQYRAYERGDEPRQIDWKLYARSDRFFVREAERESPVALWIMLDASASMADRLPAARGVAACLAELALANGDRFGLLALRGDGLQRVAPASGTQARDRLQRMLATLEAEGGLPDEALLAPLWDRIGARDLIVMLSDFFDDAAAALATRLSDAGREVLAIEILTPAERDFPFVDGHVFRDPETGRELVGDGPALRDAFLMRFGEARAALHARFTAAGVACATLFTDQPVDTPLHVLFGRRA